VTRSLAPAARGGAVILGNARILAPGRWRWLRALLWAIAIFVLLVLAFVIVVQLGADGLLMATGHPTPALGKPIHGPPAIGFAGFALGSLAALGAYAGLVRLGERRTATELALVSAPRELAAGLLLGAGMMAVTILLLWGGSWVVVARQPATAIWNALADSIESGVLEETLFRLVIFRLLWRAFGPWAALAISALMFGALHLINPNATPFAALCIALEAGVMLAAFYILTGRLWVSIGVHAGWNFTQGWVFGAAVSGTGGFAGGPLSLHPAPGAPAILSGGGFGPEASLAGLAVGTAVGAWALHRAWRAGRFAALDC
jgi:membrane protease YdiL (CAAX protease family)